MSDDLIKTLTPPTDDGSMRDFGVCPECGFTDGYLNVGREHWFRCDIHKVKWLAGSNLFSGWRDETESEWETNRRLLSDYRDVT